MSEMLDYNEKYRQRTKKFAVNIIVFYAKHCKQTEELRVIGKQLLRSGTSVAANFRAVTRGRSAAERFSKMCIVVEEIDETQFWFELIEEASLLEKSIYEDIKKEIDELVKIFTASKANMKR
ncbi:MAG: four helix bundle protein [Paludibacter sp.]|nr:four helix bundle protein [Paludibacter sp.]